MLGNHVSRPPGPGWKPHARDGAARRALPARRITASAVLLLSLAGPAVGQVRDVAIPPGINFGGSVGPTSFRGPGNGPIPGSAGWEFFIGGGLDNGLYAFTELVGKDSLNSPDLVDICYEHFANMAPLHHWLVRMARR